MFGEGVRLDDSGLYYTRGVASRVHDGRDEQEWTLVEHGSPCSLLSLLSLLFPASLLSLLFAASSSVL